MKIKIFSFFCLIIILSTNLLVSQPPLNKLTYYVGSGLGISNIFFPKKIEAIKNPGLQFDEKLVGGTYITISEAVPVPFLLKTNAIGQVTWSVYYKDVTSYNLGLTLTGYFGNTICSGPQPDNAVFLGGLNQTTSRGFVIKSNESDGLPVWSKELGTEVIDLIFDSNSNSLIGIAEDGNELIIFQYSLTGVLLNAKRTSFSIGRLIKPHIKVFNSETYVVSRYNNSSGNDEIFVSKFDPSLTIMWSLFVQTPDTLYSVNGFAIDEVNNKIGILAFIEQPSSNIIAPSVLEVDFSGSVSWYFRYDSSIPLTSNSPFEKEVNDLISWVEGGYIFSCNAQGLNLLNSSNGMQGYPITVKIRNNGSFHWAKTYADFNISTSNSIVDESFVSITSPNPLLFSSLGIRRESNSSGGTVNNMIIVQGFYDNGSIGDYDCLYPLHFTAVNRNVTSVSSPLPFSNYTFEVETEVEAAIFDMWQYPCDETPYTSRFSSISSLNYYSLNYNNYRNEVSYYLNLEEIKKPKISIVDPSGKEIIMNELLEKEGVLNTSFLPKGVFFVSLFSQGFILKTIKIIKY